MIKGIKLPVYVMVFGVCSLFASNSHSFFNPATLPFTPTFDPGNNVVHVLQNTGAAGVVKNLTDLKRTMGSLNSIKGLGDVYKKGICFVNCDVAKDDTNKKAVKASKDIQESETVDIYDQAAVKTAYYENFLVIPSESATNRKCYTELNRKFYKDTMIELYSSSVQLEKDMKDLQKKLAELEVSLEEGSSAEDAQVDKVDNTNTALENAYLANDIMDKVLRVAQELKAMDVGYEAAIANIGKASPVEKREFETLKKEGKDKDKVSFIFHEGKKFASSSHLGFAQKVAESKEDYSFLMRKVSAPKPDTLSTPFEGQQQSLTDLRAINILGEDVYAAADIHNLISELPSYRRIFESYERFVKMHNQSLILLKASDQCTVTYLGNYYSSPEQVWSGVAIGDNQYEQRKGISRWLIDTFDVAKAQMVTPVKEEDMKTSMLNVGSVDNKKVPDFNTTINSGSSEGVVRNPIKERESTKIGRENFQLPWNIGAEVSRNLGADQQASSKWGNLKKEFSIWKDNKNYYNQYVDGKYKNIVRYLERIDLRPSEIKIAREYNKQNKNKIINKFETIANENLNNKKKNKQEKCAWTKGRNCDWLADFTASEGSVSLDAIAASILLPESKWIAPVKRKLDAVPNNNAQLDTREKILEKRKNELLKRKAQLLAMLKINYSDIAKIDEELKKISIELKDLAENRNWLKEYAYDLTGVVKTEGWTVETNAELISEQAKEIELVNSLEQEFKGTLSSYNQTINKVLQERTSEIDRYNAKLEAISKQIAVSEDKIKIYTSTVNRAEEDTIAYKEEFTSSDKSAGVASSLRGKADAEKSKIKTLAKEADAIILKIDERNKYYDGKLANAEKELTIKTEGLFEREPTYDDMAPLSYLYNNKVAKAISGSDLGYRGALSGYLESAFAIAEEFRPYTVSMAEKTNSDIMNLGENLYQVKGISVVNQRHREFLDGLKEISFDKLLASSSVLKNTYGSPVGMMTFVKDLYNQYMIEVICPNDTCYANDGEYFIGLFAKGKDFQALKEPVNEYLPPLREVLFFDEVDFGTLYSKDKKIKVVDNAGATIGGITIGHSYHYVYYVSKNGIANYGGRVPEVWKLALSGQAFVEKDIDLEKFLGKDDDYTTSINFYRGGRYPCNLDGKIVDVDKNANFIMVSGSTNGLQRCQDIEFKNSNSLYSTIVAKISEATSHVGIGQAASRDYNSELGQLFAYKDNYIVYRETTEAVFSRLKEIMKYQEEQREYSTTMRDDVYDNSSLKVSQFGDFLNNVEIERAYRQAKDKIKVDLDESKEVLFEQLRKAGYEPKEDLNLANDADYNTVKKALGSKKNKLMEDVNPKIRAVAQNQNPVVKQRLENFENVFKAMEMDSEGLVSVPASNVNLSEIAESIKTEKVNMKAKEEYNKQAEDSFEKEIKKLSAPYCASY